MDPTLLTAIVSLITAIVTVLGIVATAMINNSRLDNKDKALALSVTNSVVGAVKSTAQTITAGKRDAEGRLPEVVASAAKNEALDLAKILLGSEKLQELQKKHGISGADKVIVTLLESALHDVKAVKATTVQSTSVASPGPDGSVVTTTTQAATSATEAPPLNP